MTNSNECTCPSGGGSLRHPCPTHSNENELKVGNVVSFKYNSTSWTTIKLLSLFDISTFQKNIINKRVDWQRGIHPSLIPEGFALVETCLLETSSESLDGYIRERARLVEELEAARKENERLSRDAKRYQYLRSKSLETINEGGVFAGMTPQNIILNGTDLDEAIDNEILAHV